MGRVEEFLALFCAVEQRLKELVDPPDRTKSIREIRNLAAERNGAVRNASVALDPYINLRNALTHNRPVLATDIAEPTEEGLSVFRDIAARICNPQPLTKVMQPIQPFATTDSLLAALRLMRESDYSQVVIWPRHDHDAGVGLLSVEAVARWFELHADNDYVTATDVTIAEVLAHEPVGSFTVLGQTGTVDDARDLLRREPGLYAIIITPSYDLTAKPVGIVTAWDLLEDAG